MKKFTSLLLGILVMTLSGMAQLTVQTGSNSTTNLEECATDALHQHLMANDPVYKQNMDAFNNLLKNSTVNNKMGTVYRVPVVVHVMHKGEAVGAGSNISDASIRQGIRQLNERFRKVAGSLGDGNGEDVEIEFALAVRDESNNCTDGIVRFPMTSHSNYMNFGLNRNNSNGMDESVLKGLSRWNPSEYYNIYLVYEIDNNECGFGIQGFAYLAGAHGNSVDGMVQLACKFAENGNTTLTHEIGHAFNLYHTFQGDNGGASCPSGSGDFCNDTPEHRRSSSDCVIGTNSCTGGSTTEHIHNYMDYSSDACQNEFTDDQRTRARAALTGTRASFLASNGNQSLDPPAAPTADFSASTTATCLGNAISFYDESTCIPNTFQNGAWAGISFLWTFDNGVQTPTTSTLQNPTITFANAGTYSVTLQVTNAHGNNSTIKSGYISISGGTPTAACTPSSANPPANYGYTLSNVTFETINNTTSSGSNQEYVDYSCDIATTVEVNSTYNLSVTLNNTGASNTEDVEVYIDYNDDGTFQAGELIMSKTLAAGAGSGTFTEPITIPGTATTGKILRMRAHADLNGVGGICSQTTVGDIEDYGVFITSACTQPDVPTISGTTTICNGGNTTLSIATGNLNDASDWQWYTSSCGGTSAGNGTSLLVSPSVTTTYFVRGEGGCVTGGSCAQVTVTVNNAPGNAGTITGSNSVCENAAGIGYSISAVAGATNYNWTVPSGATITSGQGSTSITVNYGTTSGSVTVTPSNSCGTGGAGSLAVSVITCAGAPDANFSASTTTICEGETVSFTDLSTNSPTNWNWSFAGGTPSNSSNQNPTITYNTAGTYSVSLTATNGSGFDTETRNSYITVIAPSGVTLDSTKIRIQDCGKTLINVTSIVYADIVTNATGYQFEVTNAGLGFSYTTPMWYNARWLRLGDIPGIQLSTTYDIRVRAKAGTCDFGPYGQTCQVTSSGNPIPNTNLIPRYCNGNVGSSNTPIYAKPITGAGNYTFEITNAALGYNQSVTNGIRYFKLKQLPGLQTNTTYDVRVRAIIGPSTGIYSKVCQITTPSSLRYTGPFLDEDEGFADELTPLEMVIYPNPNQGDFVYVELNGLQPNSSIIVMDISGKVIENRQLETDYENYTGTIRFSDRLNPGFYIVTILSGETKVSEKLIVR